MEIFADELDTLEITEHMMLTHLLEGVSVIKIFQMKYGQMLVTSDSSVMHIQYDSRKVEQGDMFVAIRGGSTDGNRFVADAVSKGAGIIVTDDDNAMPDTYFMHQGVAKILVPDTRAALAQLSAAFYGHPSRKMTMVGVTGTNGKTTTTHLMKSLLDANNKTAGLIGTIEYIIGNERTPATHTTPESLELQGLFARMVESGCKSAVMEVSSHALQQHRADSIDFSVAVFTNLSQDHLDYHGTMEEYYKAKKILFDQLDRDSWAVINIDDDWGKKLFASSQSKKLSFGIASRADVQAKKISLSIQGMQCVIEHEGEETEIQSPFVGRFNVYNILAAFSSGVALGISKSLMQKTFQRASLVPGRFERITSPKGWTAIIDYAHTPDALEKALRTIHDVLGATRRGKIITVFGCGGNRDATKRPVMGRIASELSDITIVTSDNPRQEVPEKIIEEVITGVKKGKNVYQETDRKQAVVMALGMASKDDVVLIAGKGHEDYQVVGDKKIHLSDHELVEEFLRGQK